MIKIEKGVGLLEGNLSQLQAEIVIILISLYEKMIKTDVPKKLARKMILKLFDVFDKNKERYFED